MNNGARFDNEINNPEQLFFVAWTKALQETTYSLAIFIDSFIQEIETLQSVNKRLL